MPVAVLDLDAVRHAVRQVREVLHGRQRLVEEVFTSISHEHPSQKISSQQSAPVQSSHLELRKGPALHPAVLTCTLQIHCTMQCATLTWSGQPHVVLAGSAPTAGDWDGREGCATCARHRGSSTGTLFCMQLRLVLLCSTSRALQHCLIGTLQAALLRMAVWHTAAAVQHRDLCGGSPRLRTSSVRMWAQDNKMPSSGMQEPTLGTDTVDKSERGGAEAWPFVRRSAAAAVAEFPDWRVSAIAVGSDRLGPTGECSFASARGDRRAGSSPGLPLVMGP